MLLRSESQEDGIKRRHEKHLSILNMCYLQVSSTLPTTRDSRFSTKRKPHAFMTPDGIYLFKSWKEVKDGLCKESCHWPHFVEHPPHGREGYDRVKVAYFHYRQKTRYFEEAHLHNPCLFLFVMSLTWFQVISIEQHGDVTEAL